jgi:hypothetical protein
MTTVQIQIPDQQAEALKAHAQACGLTVEQWLMRQVNQFGPSVPDVRDKLPRDDGIGEETAATSRIACMADREVRDRFHQLVDKNLESPLSALERVELDQIQVRLDAEDHDPLLEANDQKWELDRTELLQTMEDLLRKLKG